jgi:hypothetical protein
MSQVRVLGIDIATQLLHVVGMDDTGTIAWRKRLTRMGLMPCVTPATPRRHRYGGLWRRAELGEALA